MINLKHICRFAFARKILKNQLKRAQGISQDQPFQHNPLTIDFNNFNFLEGIADLNTSNSTKNSWLLQIKSVYQQHEEKCLSDLRIKQEVLIGKIDGYQQIQSKLYYIFGLKRSLGLKFRKWQGMTIDCQNSIQLLKQKRVDFPEQQYLNLYNSQCITLILSDHDRLQKLLISNKLSTHRTKRSKIENKSKNDNGIMIYQNASEMIKLIYEDSKKHELYLEAIRYQIIGLLVLGYKDEAMVKMEGLLRLNVPQEKRQEGYILLLTALSYQNDVKSLPNPKLMDILMNFNCLNEKECKQLSQYGLRTDDNEKILNNICKITNNKSIYELQEGILLKYGRLLCLLAENYYLQNKIPQCQRILQVLQKCHDQSILMITNYIRMGIFIDAYQLGKALVIFQEYRKKQMTEDRNSPSDLFYDHRLINSDILRVNMYKLAKKVYQMQGKQTEAEEISDEGLAMETTILPFTLKQPQFEEQDMKQNWRNKIEARIPYYYFNLKLESIFRPNWDFDVQIV